jgi:hypothetical protein
MRPVGLLSSGKVFVLFNHNQNAFMKKISLFIALLISTAAVAQVTKGSDQSPTGSGTANSAQSVKCCPKVYASTPATKPGGKATMRLLASKPFKGKQQGVDLSFDVLDAKGKVVEGVSDAITTNASGDVVVDRAKLPAGKYRLRARAGKASETYTIQ